MTKNFCDICGRPALASTYVELQLPIGEPYRGSRDNVDGLWQCKVRVSTRFGFEEHPTNFGGPPDLCGRCHAKLLHDLWAKAEDRRQEEEKGQS